MAKPVIICVDDEQIILTSLEQQLKNRFIINCDVELADSGEEALELIEELLAEDIEIPVVISDQIMPGLKGDELLIRIHALAPKTLKILLTGQANADAVGNAVNYANLYRYIAKPWEPADLDLTVTEALRRYFQDKQLAEQNMMLHAANAELAKLNNQLEGYSRNLEEKVKERTYELSEKNTALVKLNDEKNEFLSIAAHDLKNPLFAIQGLAQLIQKSFDHLPKEKIIQYGAMIEFASHRMFNLISNLLDVNKIESGQVDVAIHLLDILPAISDVVQSYEEQATVKNIVLHLDCIEEHYYALIDDGIVRQILDNLVSNAIKYSPKNSHVYVKIIKENKVVRCEVKDEGEGITPEEQKVLFGKFSRLSTKPTGGEHSTGLGLFIVKKLVEKLNGQVWCESEKGKGACFIVTFPA